MPELFVAVPRSVENLQLPNPELLQFYQDEKDRTIWIEGEIDETIFEVSKLILKYNKEDKGIPVEDRIPIKLFIHSPGGNLDETLAFVELIGISKTPIWTINAGWAYSAAGLILMAGHNRFALPNSQCLIHSGSGGVGGSFEQAEAQMKNYKDLVAKMREFILSKTTIDPKLFKKKNASEWYISTEEMLANGIVDKICTNLDEIL